MTRMLALHGRDHRPGGPDPIPGGLGGGPLHMVASWTGPLPEAAENGAVWRIPYLSGDPVTFDLTRAFVRIEVPGGATTSVDIEKSPAGAFVASTIASLSIPAGNYSDQETAGLGSVDSGELVRIAWTALGAAEGIPFTVELEGTEA